jgi:hypothetical protein
MRITKFCVLLITAASLSMDAMAQTADDIIAKSTDAMGGKDKLAQVKSVYTEATVSVMGTDNPASTTLLAGKGYLSTAEINGSKIVQCYNEKGGWMINPFAGASDPTPMPDDQYLQGKNGMYVGGALMNYKALGYTAQLLPKDGNNYPVKVSGNKFESTFFIDANTYLINKIVSKANSQGQVVDITTTLSDYKKTDFGTMDAYKIDVDLGQIQLGYVVKSITVNKDIDPKIFDMPGK